MSRSGAGASAAATPPIATGTKPSIRQRRVHRHSQTPPVTIAANAHVGIDGRSATAPRDELTQWARPSSASIEIPHNHQKGAPNPSGSNASAAASSGMMTKVVSGIAMMLAPTP